LNGGTDTATLTITVAGVTPIAIDLNGNGIDFIGVDKSITHFDMDNNGHPDRTAWVGPDDGILAIDLNGDRAITNKSEFVFTDHAPEAKTDMEALQIAFDTDGDNYLTPEDAKWKEFGIWQDSNSDAKTDEGEFKSLDEMGVISIDLTHDNQSSSPADGIWLFGESEVKFADGHTVAAGDAAFSYVPSDSGDEDTGHERFTIQDTTSFNDMVNGSPANQGDFATLQEISSERQNHDLLSDSNEHEHESSVNIWQSDMNFVEAGEHHVFSSGEDMAHNTDDGFVSDVYHDHRMDHQ